MKLPKNILIMAGGTGGHIFPGLVVADYLRSQGIEINWLGTQKGLEAKLVPQAGFPLHLITISGVKGKGWKDKLLFPSRLLFAVLQSLLIIKKLKPDIVIGMGGFVSGPGGIASILLRRSLLIHEQNARPGFTNKYLAKIAKKILTGFPNTFPNESMIGNPVRKEIANLAPPSERFAHRSKPLRLLVLGGSLGASALNDLLPKALAAIDVGERPEVIHQTGEAHYESTRRQYQDLGISVNIKPFIREMDQAYAWADIVLCRAGALTIAELCAAGLGAILVPFPYAINDHQTANGIYIQRHQAAILIPQSELTIERFIQELRQLTHEKCMNMAQAAYQLRKTDTAEKLLSICQEICQ